MLDICYIPIPNGQDYYICRYVKAIWEQRDGRDIYAGEKCLRYGKMLESVFEGSDRYVRRLPECQEIVPHK